ncbi:HNH endonuclease [Chitinophaga sp. RAB17]|uniref:HNH endonuclease n=1 Tax=Chitinophaga sp. RAB17 TaxID=3233049 RepID=UPI003F92CC19
MRPVSFTANPTYQIPLNMRTNTQAIRSGLAANGINPVLGKTTYRTQRVLDLLQTLTFTNRGADNWSNLSQLNQGLVISLINYFSKNDNVNYGNARGSLIENYGQYCNYCGMPVQDSSLAVEHRLPKAEFPGLMLNYMNFFLACPMCNSYKGSKPTFTVCRSWAINRQGIPAPNMVEVGNGGYDRQVWPNRPAAYTGFTPILYNQTTDAQVPLQYALNINNDVVNTENNTVQAILPGYKNGQEVTVAVRFESVDALVQGLREDNFISIVNLNFTEADNYSDRRVTNRTVAWMNALLSMFRLSGFQPGSAEYDYMVNQILSTVQAAGYYSIWAYVFYQKSPPTVQNSVYTSFKTETADPTRPQFYFPGTNAANMP